MKENGEQGDEEGEENDEVKKNPRKRDNEPGRQEAMLVARQAIKEEGRQRWMYGWINGMNEWT